MNTATYRVRQRQRNTHSQRNITTHSVTDVETQQARTTKNDGQIEIAGHHSPHTRDGNNYTQKQYTATERGTENKTQKH